MSICLCIFHFYDLSDESITWKSSVSDAVKIKFNNFIFLVPRWSVTGFVLMESQLYQLVDNCNSPSFFFSNFPLPDPLYTSFHDEEWGVPVHDDKKLFELLVLSQALAELSWPTILNKRDIFRYIHVALLVWTATKSLSCMVIGVLCGSSAGSFLTILIHHLLQSSLKRSCYR